MKETRSIKTQFSTREDENNTPIIEGYFSVFGETYELMEGMTEEIAPGAFGGQCEGDVRALADHNTLLVLGRTTAGTLELREDKKGLYGVIKINPEDSDAMNLYARVKRGDVSQCSFGFDILDEVPEKRDNGEMHWTIRKVKLYEVSVCTFPAYESTQVTARTKSLENIKQRQLQKWRDDIKMRLNRKED